LRIDLRNVVVARAAVSSFAFSGPWECAITVPVSAFRRGVWVLGHTTGAGLLAQRSYVGFLQLRTCRVARLGRQWGHNRSSRMPFKCSAELLA
jgi:hypothetical protein